MKITVQTNIQADRTTVWNVVTNFENAVNTISGIEELDVLERPENGLVGFKWKETRTLFGKTATEVMWITDAREGEFYDTRAESHGAIYTSRISLADSNGGTLLTMSFHGEPQTFGAKLMSGLLGWMFKGATVKALQKDLDDIKAAAESAT